jgi:hypothetical protein
MVHRGFTRSRARRAGASSASACCLVLGFAASSQAATVAVEPDPLDPRNLERLRFAAAADERNALSITARLVPSGDATESLRSTWTFHDPGAAVRAGASCVSIDAHTVECAAPPYSINRVFVTLGDLDDELIVGADTPESSTFTVVHAGDGDDRLTSTMATTAALHGNAGADQLIGSPAPDKLWGGAGDDRISGGGADDRLTGGDGADRLIGGEGDDRLADGEVETSSAARDVFDGGAGRDTVSYRARATGVEVDLRDPDHAGAPGESDRLLAVENAAGGHGDDVLSGDAEDNVIRGWEGWDRVRGRGGEDSIDLDDGGGRADCGEGSDGFPFGVSRQDYLERDCEGIYGDSRYPPIFTAYPRAYARHRVRFRLSCPIGELDGEPYERMRCSGTVRIHRARGRRILLAAGRFRSRRWSSHLVDVHLTPEGRRLAARHGGVRSTVTFEIRASGFDDSYADSKRWRIRLRAG